MTELDVKQRRAVVAEARSWLGTPYHHMGRVKGAGVDCAMLPAEVYAACGLIPRQEVSFYPMDWNMHRGGERYLAQVLEHAVEIAEPPQPGDLVLWRYGRCLAHGAIVLEWPRIIHAVVRLGVVLDDGLSPSLMRERRDGRPRERHVYSLWRARP